MKLGLQIHLLMELLSSSLYMDSGASKSVMSSKHFMSIPELFRHKLCNTRMKFQVANGEVLNAIGVGHESIQMHRYTFKLAIFVCDLGESGLTQMSMMNQNSCLGVVEMLSAIFEQ